MNECIRDIEFGWTEKNGRKVLMYRICKGLGFRGWKNWEEVKDIEQYNKDVLPREYDDSHNWG